MPRIPIRKYALASVLGLGATGAVFMGTSFPGTPAFAQVNVFDPSNYAQNLLTAARALTQINNQIQSLQNEAQILTNQRKHLNRIDFPQLTELQQRLQQIDRLMGQAQGIDYRVDRLDERFRQLYPQDFDRALRSDRRVLEARARLDTSMAGFRQAMKLQSGIVENVRDDAEALSAIVARSQSAEGSLQAQQAPNQLLALTAKQQFQLQQMMAAQFRSEAIEQARRLQESEEARAATKRFIGDGKAYTPLR